MRKHHNTGMAVVASLFALLTAANVTAGDSCGCQKPANCMNHGCGEGCCMLSCSPEYKTVKIKKQAFDVECEPVCVPQVQCPSLKTMLGIGKPCGLLGCGLFSGHCSDSCCNGCGQNGCNGGCRNGQCNNDCHSPACAEVRMVRKLKKIDYEVEKCVIEWKVQPCASGCGKCCSGHGPSCGCGRI